jgi:hypothetical protein
MLLLEGKAGPQLILAPLKFWARVLPATPFIPPLPDPEGMGPFSAMKGPLKDAGLNPWDIDYVNLHGTGTLDNDLAEAKAFNRLFDGKPLVSSVKGAFGHSLSQQGPLRRWFQPNALKQGLRPPAWGAAQPIRSAENEPAERIRRRAPIRTVLSNAFGFGGSNASLVIGRSEKHRPPVIQPAHSDGGRHFLPDGCGNTADPERLFKGLWAVKGLLSDKEISQTLSPRAIRRLKRLSRMGLSLATAAFENAMKMISPNPSFSEPAGEPFRKPMIF